MLTYSTFPFNHTNKKIYIINSKNELKIKINYIYKKI